MTHSRKEMLIFLSVFALMFLGACWFIFEVIEHGPSVEVPCDKHHWRFDIPTPTELQVFLEVNPDGVIGKGTRAKWQEYIDTQRSAYWFDPNNYKVTE